MATRARAQVEHDLIRRCHTGLDVAAVRENVLRSLRLLMPIDAAFFATADPDTLLFTSGYPEEPLSAAMQGFLDNEFGGNDVNKFASLATGRSHVASLDWATGGDRWSSRRYRDIMRPLALGDELRAALVIDSVCWGYLCLHRSDHPLGFTSSEAAVIARAGPHIAHALRQAILLHPAATPPKGGDTQPPGIVLLAEDLDVVAITPEADHLISLMQDDHTPSLPLPVAVYTVASALAAIERRSATPDAPPSMRVRTMHGQWLDLHASRLRGPTNRDNIAVVIQPAQPRATVPILLSAYRLTPREAEVVRLVLRGASTQTISNTLHISHHTVQDYLKKIFEKLGVRSRRDLVGHLLAGGAERS